MERSGLGRPEENTCQINWAFPERKILNIMVSGGPRFLAPEIDLKFVTRLALLRCKRRRAPTHAVGVPISHSLTCVTKLLTDMSH